MSRHLDGKVAAITGAASGIGLASTRAMIEEGARVVLVDRDRKALDKVCAELGEAALPLEIDLLDPVSCATLMPSIEKLTG